MRKEPVIIEQMEDNLYHVYDESGQCVEPDFDTFEEAESWVKDNSYLLVHSFN